MNIRNRSVNVRALDSGLGVGKRTGNGITVKSQKELDRMMEAGSITGLTLLKLRDSIAAGMTTADMDAIAEREIRALGGIPAFKGYRGFPATLCISINEEIVHGIPGGRAIKELDIVGLDLGAIVDGMYGDSALTVPVGRISDRAAELLRVTREALNLLARSPNLLARRLPMSKLSRFPWKINNFYVKVESHLIYSHMNFPFPMSKLGIFPWKSVTFIQRIPELTESNYVKTEIAA